MWNTLLTADSAPQPFQGSFKDYTDEGPSQMWDENLLGLHVDNVGPLHALSEV